MSSITSVNSILVLSVLPILPVFRIQEFAEDDMFDLEDIEVSEDVMGVDGKLSSGLIYNKVPLTITLMANSPACVYFDTWYAAERQILDKYFANGSITFPSIRQQIILTNGNLKKYSPGPSAKKILQPRKFTINFESILTAPY